MRSSSLIFAAASNSRRNNLNKASEACERNRVGGSGISEVGTEDMASGPLTMVGSMRED
jgi:hypothetical protein